MAEDVLSGKPVDIAMVQALQQMIISGELGLQVGGAVRVCHVSACVCFGEGGGCCPWHCRRLS